MNTYLTMKNLTDILLMNMFTAVTLLVTYLRWKFQIFTSTSWW